MKNTLLLAALLLSGCAASHNQREVEKYYDSHPESQWPASQSTVPEPGTVRVEPARTFLDKVLNRPAKDPLTVPAATVTKIGKKSTVYYGPATITTVGKKATAATAEGATATVIGKKAGPSVVASDSSTINAVTGGGNLAAINGDGNTIGQTESDAEAPGPWAVLVDNLTGPLGYVLAGAVVLGIVVFLARRKAAKTLVS